LVRVEQATRLSRRATRPAHLRASATARCGDQNDSRRAQHLTWASTAEGQVRHGSLREKVSGESPETTRQWPVPPGEAVLPPGGVP